MNLSLDTTGTVAASQLLNLGNSDHIRVTLDGVLQSGSCHCELDSSLGVLTGQQAVNQTAAEGVTTAHAVDDVQVVLLGEAVLVLCDVVQHSTPAVIEGRVALTQGDSDLLEAELVSQLLSNGLVAFVVDGAAVDVGSMPRCRSQDMESQSQRHSPCCS